MAHYDLIVIGTGSGLPVVDDRFTGWRVAIVERRTFGGTCLNRGCIPSKMLVLPADIARSAGHGSTLGVHTSADGVDWPAVRDRVFARTDGVSAEGKAYREGQDDVDVLTGNARFVGPRQLHVDLESGESVTITGDQVVVAAGGRPVVPDIDGLADVEHHTSDTVMHLKTLPARLGVLGGGYIGAEFAHVFSAYGAHVTQVESEGLLLGTQDADVARFFTEAAAQRWDVRLGTDLERVRRAAGGIEMHLSDGTMVEVDTLLVATGRRPNSDQLDLDAAGIDTDDRGLVVVDEYQRTTADGVWALGDISSPEPLKHVANQDSRIVQHNLLHPDDLIVSDHRFVPQAVFSEPQVASVGLTEEQARERGTDLAVAVQKYGDTAYGWALEDTTHFVKLLGDRATGRLVGAHLVGPHASMLIQPLIQAMSFDQPVAGLARGQYWIHPALTEVVENALLQLADELR